MPLADIYGIGVHIRGYDEQAVLVTAYVQAFALSDGIELRSVVPAYYLAGRVLLISCLPDVFFP